MPLYEWSCINCGYKHEVIEKFEDADKEHFCPFCQTHRMTRQFPNKVNFKLIFNQKTDMCDWYGNRNQYWDQYRAAKARGEDVKPANEE